MAAADRRTIAAGTPIDELIDRAGRAVAWEVRRRIGGGYGRRAVVVCGKGNNGGDGLVAARVLARLGHARARGRARASGIDRAAFDARARARRPRGRRDVRHRVPRRARRRRRVGGRGVRRGGRARGGGRHPVGRRRPHRRGPRRRGARALDGHLRGAQARAAVRTRSHARRASSSWSTSASTSADVDADRDLRCSTAPTSSGSCRRAPRTAHKWAAGVMVVGGSGGMTGAPMLASRAALRAGAGIVWCGLPGDDAARHASGGEVITRALPSADGNLSPTAVDARARRHRSLRRAGARARARNRPGARRAVAGAGGARRRCRWCSTPTGSTRSTATSRRSCSDRRAAASPCSRRTTASTRASPASRSAPTGSRRRGDSPIDRAQSCCSRARPR